MFKNQLNSIGNQDPVQFTVMRSSVRDLTPNQNRREKDHINSEFTRSNFYNLNQNIEIIKWPRKPKILIAQKNCIKLQITMNVICAQNIYSEYVFGVCM